MVCNLHQNPHRRPVVASWLPALLRAGTMFLIGVNVHSNDDKEERWLLDTDTGLNWFICQTRVISQLNSYNSYVFFSQEHLHSMGICQFKDHAPPGEAFPTFSYNPPSTVKKRLAGNVLRRQCNTHSIYRRSSPSS